MFLSERKYIISLIDASENVIEGSVCMEGFAHHQLLMVDNDGWAISQEIKETPFFAGDIIYVAAGRRFALRCNGIMRIRHIAFTGRSIRPLMHYCRFGEFCITSPHSNIAKEAFDEIFALKKSNTENKQAYLSVALYSLISELGGINIENESGLCDEKSLLLRSVTGFMQDSYRTSAVPLADIAQAVGRSTDELDMLFYERYAMNAAQFYKKLRMENAKHLLFYYAADGTEYVAENMGYAGADELEADFYAQFGMNTAEFVRLYVNSV